MAELNETFSQRYSENRRIMQTVKNNATKESIKNENQKFFIVCNNRRHHNRVNDSPDCSAS